MSTEKSSRTVEPLRRITTTDLSRTTRWGVHQLEPGEFWLFSDHPGAYDSRYFGPVHETNVLAVLKPVWTWR
ncbi:MAG: S26 family signal peptidase [Longimicrobiales bacterium]